MGGSGERLQGNTAAYVDERRQDGDASMVLSKPSIVIGPIELSCEPSTTSFFLLLIAGAYLTAWDYSVPYHIAKMAAVRFQGEYIRN